MDIQEVGCGDVDCIIYIYIYIYIFRKEHVAGSCDCSNKMQGIS